MKVLFMNLRVAFIFYFLGLLNIIDWIIFWNNHSDLVSEDYKSYKQLYINHFPALLRPLHTSNPEPATILMMVFFCIAGFFFFKQEKTAYTIIGITSFIFAILSLVSLI